MDEHGERSVVAFKFGDDIVKLTVYYFSRLPLVENKSRCNSLCARFYGIILLMVASATTLVQILLMNYQWQAVSNLKKENLFQFEGYEYVYIVKPGMWAYQNDTSKEAAETVSSPIPQSIGDEAIKAMMISTVILTLVIGENIYQHMKAFCIAIGLPYANRGVTTFFHIFGGSTLAVLSLCQIMFSSAIQIISYYQIISSENIMDIYQSAAGLLFINSISNIVGLFFKIWVKDDAEGLRLLCAETFYRPEMEVVAKVVAYAQVSYSIWWCQNNYYAHPRWVDLMYNSNRWYEMIYIPLLIMIISLIVAFAFVGNSFITLSIQGLEIDPDEDKEELLMKQIENSVKEWFAFHKYDNKDKQENERMGTEENTVKSKTVKNFSMFSKSFGRIGAKKMENSKYTDTFIQQDLSVSDVDKSMDGSYQPQDNSKSMMFKQSQLGSQQDDTSIVFNANQFINNFSVSVHNKAQQEYEHTKSVKLNVKNEGFLSMMRKKSQNNQGLTPVLQTRKQLTSVIEETPRRNSSRVSGSYFGLQSQQKGEALDSSNRQEEVNTEVKEDTFIERQESENDNGTESEDKTSKVQFIQKNIGQDLEK